MRDVAWLRLFPDWEIFLACRESVRTEVFRLFPDLEIFQESEIFRALETFPESGTFFPELTASRRCASAWPRAIKIR
jgi:hypothetical protein